MALGSILKFVMKSRPLFNDDIKQFRSEFVLQEQKQIYRRASFQRGKKPLGEQKNPSCKDGMWEGSCLKFPATHKTGMRKKNRVFFLI